MPAYLERYLVGEHERVWAELVALGGDVRQEPFYSDALAVARETMRRARANIETLIQRLTTLGYRFGWESRDPTLGPHLSAYRADVSSWPPIIHLFHEARRPPPQFASPPAGTPELLETLQARYGLFPLSLVSWYEMVGAVNLAGSFPVADPLDPEGFNDLYQYRAACANGHMDQYQGPPRDLDPLWVYPLEQQQWNLEQQDIGMRQVEGGERIRRLLIAPRERAKQGFEGWSEAQTAIPNAGADALLWSEWYDITFVEYLRLCFRWGGFPGLATRARKPDRELAILTADLLPI